MLTVPGPAFLTILGALSSGLTIETGSPDAHCPDLALTQKAADARLGILAVEGPGKWKAVYNIVHAPERDGDLVHLELFDPKGERRLERNLPLAGESCSTMAQVVALVLERYFSDVSRDREARASAPTESPRVEGGTRMTSTPEGRSYAASLALGAGLASPPSAPALVLDARIWIQQRLHLGLGAAWSPTEREEQVGPPAGRARLSVFPVRASLGIGKEFAAGYAYLGPDALVSFDRAATTGIATPGETRRLVFGLGASGGVVFWLARPLALTLQAAADVTLPLAMSQLVVSRQEVLTQQWIQGFAAIGLSYVIFR
jgi:hypothetical protein